MANSATRQVSIFINGREVANQIKSIAGEQKKLNNELALTTRGTAEYEAKALELRKVNAILKEHNDGLRGIRQGVEANKAGLGSFIGVAAGAFTVGAIIGYGKELFNTSVKLETLAKKARTVFGEALPQITAEAEKNATAMGLTTAQYVGQAAAIQDLLVPMGFQRKTAADISAQLLNLSGALSEWTGGQRSAEEVATILNKSLLGERDELKSLGISIQQADVDARVFANGMSKASGQAKQQAEAMATLQLIMEKSTDAQQAYTENADSNIRRTAELTAKFEEAKEKLAGALTPAFEALVVSLSDAATFSEALQQKLGGLAGALTPFLGAGVGNIFEKLFGTGKGGFNKDQAEKDLADLQALTQELQNQYGPAKAPEVDPKAQAEAQKKAEALAKKRQEQAKKEAEQEQKDLATLTKQTADLKKDLQDKAIKDEYETAIRAVEKRYEDEIAKATELESKGVKGATELRLQLEQTKAQEILLVTHDLAVKEQEKAVKEATDKAKAVADADLKVAEETEAFKAQRAQERAAAEAELKAFLNEGLLSDREGELLSLNDHYNNLLKLAEEYGLNTTNLKEAHAKQQAEIEKKYADKSAKDQEETQKARLAALQSSFSAFGDFVTATFDLLGGEGEKAAEFQKIATLAKIAFDTASAISSLVATSEANPLNAVTFGSAGFAQYVAGFARIIANIGQARKILSGAPKVQQKYTGSYLDVTGAQDGRAYHAQSIATPSTGLLPNFPVLFNSNATGAPVLASERGAEYFVASNDLRNPRVANYVRMIDNITHGGASVSQFATGGVNAPSTTAPAGGNAEQMAMMGMLAQAVNTLNAILSVGIKAVAVIGDQDIVDLDKRFGVINAASGGYYK